MDVDLRSRSLANLDDLQNQLQHALRDATSASGVECEVTLMGERPTGATSLDSSLVQAAVEITRRLGAEPQLDVASTDANIPMSLGIPAIAIGGGGSSGNVHTPGEWFDPTRRDLGLQRLLALVAVLAGSA